MSAATASIQATGCGFLIENAKTWDVFTPEDFSDEHVHIAKLAASFSNNEILPVATEIEAKQFHVTRALLRRAGDLGLLAADIPEAYGGLEMDKVTSALITESLTGNASFSVVFSAHTGLGTLPIVWYGDETQKRKYLPKLAGGEWVAAYALTEASSGSDALNIRTRAVLSGDGRHYTLNGEKMWISNCGFADLYTVFAKVDGRKFSAFLVEGNTPGLTTGAEEDKLGIQGSSTCPLILNDCLVPAENLLGEVGQGHHIAFNILNMGRFKLGAACVGSARTALQHTIEYATQRKAFGRCIAEFGLVQEKIAECATGIYAGEALTYRTIGTIDTAGIATPDVRKCIEAYAVECSIVKVWASEMLDGVVDHAVQIYGGYGYVESYPAAAAYRNARINRIFEGTNEINRLIIAGSVVRRSIAGQLPPQSHDEEFLGPLAAERGILAKAKSISLFVLDAACRKYRHELLNQQEIMGALADCVIEVYAVESCLLRAEKLLAAKGGHNAGNAMAMTRLYQVKAMQTIRAAATKVMAAVVEGDTLSAFFDYPPADTIALSRRIARHVIGAGRYRI